MTLVTREAFDTLASETLTETVPWLRNQTFAQIGSWTTWAEQTTGDTSWSRDTSAMTWGDLGGRLHNRVVFVTLNKGSGTVQDPAADWASFHSGTHDYLLAEAIGQPGIQEVFGGAYITDFFKGLPPSTTGSLNLLLDSLSAIAQARTVQAMEALLERELHILGCERPLLIGVGRDAERWLRKRMNSFRVVGISHYEDVECPDAYARELKRAAMFVSSRTVRA